MKWSEMTPRQRDVALAKKLGWIDILDSFGFWRGRPLWDVGPDSRGLLAIDNTWTLGSLYLDICGRVGWRDIEIGIAFQFRGDSRCPWNPSLTLRLLFWAVSIGVNP